MSSAELAAQARRKAMDLLARREHSRCELRRKLLDICDDHELLEQQLERLAAQGLQSDARFAESYLRSKMAAGKGPLWIRAQLSHKGVDAALLATLFEAVADQWSEQALQVYQKKYGHQPVADARDRARRLRFMQARGFGAQHINALPLFDRD